MRTTFQKGTKRFFKKKSKDAEYGTETTHIYYKNKTGSYLCCVITAREAPFLINMGNPKKSDSLLKKIFKSLPRTFDNTEIKKVVPQGIPNDISTVLAVADVLEHEKFSEKAKKSAVMIVYNKKKRA